jgi:hypothetical protein
VAITNLSIHEILPDEILDVPRIVPWLFETSSKEAAQVPPVNAGSRH